MRRRCAGLTGRRLPVGAAHTRRRCLAARRLPAWPAGGVGHRGS